MSIGIVRKKNNGWASTPNQGIVLDFETGLEYPFYRPDAEVGTVPTDWNVFKNDIISYTIINGVATNPVLYKKYEKGTVYYKPT